jgi:tellurite resistance protein
MALSWLRWYQVIVVADEGHERDAREKTYEALREDARLNEFEHREVGKRQYQLLRRFIDQYSEWFREPSLIGTVAQALQSRLEL